MFAKFIVASRMMVDRSFFEFGYVAMWRLKNFIHMFDTF